MKKLRIAQVVSLQESIPPKGKNGLEYMVYYLTEELVRRGHEVTLFASKDSKTSAKLVDVLPYSAAKKRLFGWNTTNYSLAGMSKAAEMADEFDVIHTHIGSVAFYFVELIKTPIVETVHSPTYKSSGKARLSKKLIDKYTQDRLRRYKKAHHVFVSKSQKDNASIKNNSVVIHNGIDLEKFKFRKTSRDYFLYLGYITPDKGAHIAVQAAKRAKVKLKLAGSYEGCEEYFKKKIKPYLKKGEIEYVGIVNPIKRNQLLGGAKAILVPIQWEEPFGLIMTEAMACGTPVIGFNRAAVPEIVKDKKTGFVVEDAKEMVRAIKKIDEISRIECREHAEKYFTVEKMTDGYEKVYEKAIKSFSK
ncbi:MAG: glycosyltransferase family 4 protein [Candidatus Pacebacteria bacterium]|nr:glycosyltransferase family 4 protein [Candidatus Paceibacterota bacterium]